MALSIRRVAASHTLPFRKTLPLSPDMTQPITLPLWLFLLIVLSAAITFASHFLFPSVRWFFRKRAERVVARINKRLVRPIEPFKLARRHDMIQRLSYDPEVSKAIAEFARENNVPENVGFEKAQRYAREIVPRFSATAYFAVGIRLAHWLARSLYRVRVTKISREDLQQIETDAAVVFVMNHRSNMDYVLVTYLVSRASVLSYAVGEWARIWPLSAVIRSMGAYFIRRQARDGLYRKVLARYVQLATQGGVTQAVFPEGGLSLTGSQAPAKLGLLNYIVSAWAPGERDVLFVPVALNYDHVLEDRYLISAGQSGVRRFRPPMMEILRGFGGHLLERMTFRFRKFGTASVGFGAPVRLSDLSAVPDDDMTQHIADLIMARIAEATPILPVPLVATALLNSPTNTEALARSVTEQLARLREAGRPIPKRSGAQIIEDGLGILEKRSLVKIDGQTISIAPEAQPILVYYAQSIAHHFTDL